LAQNATDAYNRYCLENNLIPILKLKSVNLLEDHQKACLNQYYNQHPDKKVEYQVKIKSKLFCCFNKMIREHRIRIFYNILKNSLLDKTYSSFQYGKEVTEQLRLQKNYEMYNVFRKYAKVFPLVLNMDDERYNPIDVREGDFIYHEDSYFSLITETLFFKDRFDAGNSVLISEKTFRAVIHKHPFVLVAPAKSLYYLKRLGYKTFSPYIDESYDDIDNDEERLQAVWKEVERLCSFTDNEWLEWQRGVAEIVNYNYQLIMNKNNYVLD
jgi:hypothetical protein